MQQERPLDGIRVVERASDVAAAWTGRLLAAMGAEVIMIEAPTLCPLRLEAPLLPDGSSALFAYLAADKRSIVCDLTSADGQGDLHGLLQDAQILIDDTPLAQRSALGLDQHHIAARHPHLVHLSVLPFGASGPKAGWKGSEINLIHAGGEGFLLPNGLSATLFPDRPPLKIAGHFAQFQGGTAAALSALAALWSGQGQYVDTSVQEANVMVGAFALQRLGDGSVEHRLTRSFRYGGVIECRDGYVELLTLEDRQWRGLVHLLGDPDWAQGEAMADPVLRSAQGDAINERIREWARHQDVDTLVARAQELGVPMARYNTPEQILNGQHENHRGIFQSVRQPEGTEVRVQTAPFRFGSQPLRIDRPAPPGGADQHLVSAFESVRRVIA